MKENKNYQWVIAGAAFLMTFVFIGLGNSTNSLYTIPVTEYYGYSRSQFSMLFSIISIMGLFTSMAYGVLYSKLGIKKIIALGTLCISSAFLVFYFGNSLTTIYIGAVLIGIGLVLTSTISISILVNSWFTKNKGTIMGVIFAGSGIGGTVFSMFISNYMNGHTFKEAYLISAIILFVTAIPVILLITEKTKKERPIEGNSTSESHPTVEAPKEKFGNIVKRPGVLIGLIGVVLIGITIHPTLIVVPSHLVDKGFTPSYAASIYGAAYLVLAVAKIVLGVVNDKFGVKVAMTIGLGSYVIATAILINASTNLMAWAFAFFFGTAAATLSVLIPLFTTKLVGEENLERFLGIFMMFMTVGIIAGIPIINAIYDAFGSYRFGLIAYMIIGMVALFLILASINKVESHIEVLDKA